MKEVETFLSISFIPITNKVNAHEWSDSEFNDILMAIINHQEFFNANDFQQLLLWPLFVSVWYLMAIISW